MNYIRKGTISIEPTINGFMVSIYGTIEDQEDERNNKFVFENYENLEKFLKEKLKKQRN